MGDLGSSSLVIVCSSSDIVHSSVSWLYIFPILGWLVALVSWDSVGKFSLLISGACFCTVSIPA